MMDNLIGATLFFSSYFFCGLVTYFVALKNSRKEQNRNLKHHYVQQVKSEKGLFLLGWPIVIAIGLYGLIFKLIDKMAGE